MAEVPPSIYRLLSGSELKLLMHILDLTDRGKLSLWEKWDEVASRSGQGWRTCYRAAKKLKERGIIDYHTHPDALHGQNQFVVLDPKMFERESWVKQEYFSRKKRPKRIDNIRQKNPEPEDIADPIHEAIEENKT